MVRISCFHWRGLGFDQSQVREDPTRCRMWSKKKKKEEEEEEEILNDQRSLMCIK